MPHASPQTAMRCTDKQYARPSCCDVATLQMVLEKVQGHKRTALLTWLLQPGFSDVCLPSTREQMAARLATRSLLSSYALRPLLNGVQLVLCCMLATRDLHGFAGLATQS